MRTVTLEGEGDEEKRGFSGSVGAGDSDRMRRREDVEKECESERLRGKTETSTGSSRSDGKKTTRAERGGDDMRRKEHTKVAQTSALRTSTALTTQGEKLSLPGSSSPDRILAVPAVTFPRRSPRRERGAERGAIPSHVLVSWYSDILPLFLTSRKVSIPDGGRRG